MEQKVQRQSMRMKTRSEGFEFTLFSSFFCLEFHSFFFFLCKEQEDSEKKE
jgi:hypothetical protein